MHPLYFGSSASPLYGVYHPPKARVGRRTGVVLCYPFGQEYMRAHRAYRQLALSLAKVGFHVFRFDYTGTGDSAGESDAFGIATSVVDVGFAIDELRDTADVEQVLLMGVRLGGTIAALAAASREDVSQLVLWDALLDGGAYANELLADAKPARGPAADGAGTDSGALGVMGYPLTDSLQRELRTITIGAGSAPTIGKVLMLCDAETPESVAAAEWLTAAGRQVTYRVEPLPGRWNEVDNWGSAMIPQAAIQAIVGWISEEVR